MAWVSVNKLGGEIIHSYKPVREKNSIWISDNLFRLPKGSIKKLIGKELTWNDEPVELEDEK